MSNLLRRGLSHIHNSWRHHAGLQLSTLVILSTSFSAILAVLTLTTNLQNILTLWGDSLQMSVFVNESAGEDRISKLKKSLTENLRIEKVKYVSSEKALLDFKEQMASYAPGLLNDNDLLKFIPTSFQLSLKNVVNSESQLDVMKTLATEIKSYEGVDEVSFGQDWVKNYSIITKVINSSGVIFIAITILGSLFVISNSIRSSITQRKNEIEVLELIGATQGYIRWPFIAEGALLGFFSTTVSISISFGLFYWLKDSLHQQLSFLQLSNHITFLSPSMGLIFVLSGITLGALSALVCVRQINSGWAAVKSQIKLAGE